MTDAMLRQRVIDEIEFEPRVEGQHIAVMAERGVVTLTGHVASIAERMYAVEAARRVRGVRAIAVYQCWTRRRFTRGNRITCWFWPGPMPSIS